MAASLASLPPGKLALCLVGGGNDGVALATAFVLAQRYRLLEAETSSGAVLSTAASVLSVSLVMTLLAAR